MKKIIEGCDGVGKSTIIRELLKINPNLSYFHLTKNDSREFLFYKELLKKQEVIYDRHFISEYIYSKCFNRPTDLNMNRFYILMSLAILQDFEIIILTAEDDIIIERLKSKNENQDIIKKAKLINQEYLKLARKCNLRIIDTTNKTSREVLKEIIQDGKY